MAGRQFPFPSYDVATLKHNLAQCLENIETYEKILQRELDRQAELRRLIAICETPRDTEQDDEFE